MSAVAALTRSMWRCFTGRRRRLASSGAVPRQAVWRRSTTFGTPSYPERSKDRLASGSFSGRAYRADIVSSTLRSLTKDVEEFLRAAIAEAEAGLAEGGIPIGSVLVHGGQIIGRGHNRRVQRGSAILHGEMDALENAGRL